MSKPCLVHEQSRYQPRCDQCRIVGARAEIDSLKAQLAEAKKELAGTKLWKEVSDGKENTLYCELYEARAQVQAYEAVVEAAKKLTEFCPALEAHGSPKDCLVYGCKEARDALQALNPKQGERIPDDEL